MWVQPVQHTLTRGVPQSTPLHVPYGASGSAVSFPATIAAAFFPVAITAPAPDGGFRWLASRNALTAAGGHATGTPPAPHEYVPDGPVEAAPYHGYCPPEVREEAFGTVLEGIDIGQPRDGPQDRLGVRQVHQHTVAEDGATSSNVATLVAT